MGEMQKNMTKNMQFITRTARAANARYENKCFLETTPK